MLSKSASKEEVRGPQSLFADDLRILATTEDGLQRRFTKLQETLEWNGFNINGNKIEVKLCIRVDIEKLDTHISDKKNYKLKEVEKLKKTCEKKFATRR